MRTQSSLASPCILIYNPISGHGHLDSWNAMFVSILLSAGWRINVLTPDAQDLIKRLALKHQSGSANLNILSWNVLQPTFIQRVIGRIKRSRLKRMFGFPREGSALDVDLDPRFLDPLDFVRRVNVSLKKCRWRPNFVFNMYMDMYPAESMRWHLFENICQFAWAGIRFVPTLTHTETYYAQHALKGMCFLDQQACDQASQKWPNKAFGFLPDITERALPNNQSEDVRHIKERAGDRKVVFMGGTIGGNKNLSRWYQLIAMADSQKYYFVQIGEMFEDTLTAEDRKELATIRNVPPENLYIKLEYLPDEAIFNEIIQASDVIFAVYRDFKISSNMPGKSAAFSKPILVARGHLMGERVEQYGIGLAVSEDDVTVMHDGLQTLAFDSALIESMQPNFAVYRNDFSEQALGNHLVGFLNRCMAKQ